MRHSLRFLLRHSQSSLSAEQCTSRSPRTSSASWPSGSATPDLMMEEEHDMPPAHKSAASKPASTSTAGGVDEGCGRYLEAPSGGSTVMA